MDTTLNPRIGLLNPKTGLPFRAGIPDLMASGEIAREIYPEYTYDTAVPWPWQKHCMEHGIDIRGRAVWLYRPRDCLGSPAALDHEFMEEYHDAFNVYPVCPKDLP